MHSGQYAYRDRKQKKRDFRKLWITRINAACRENGVSYSRFIEGLNKAGVEVNRKMLSEIAINDPKMFAEFVKISESGRSGKVEKKEVNSKAEVSVNSSKAKSTEAPKVKKADKEEKVKADVDYSKMTVAELREIAKSKGIASVSTMKKSDLLEALK